MYKRQPSKKGQATGREGHRFPGDTNPGCQTPTMWGARLADRRGEAAAKNVVENERSCLAAASPPLRAAVVEEGSGNRERSPSVSRRHLSRLPNPYNGARVRPIVGARRRRITWLKTNGLVSPPPRPLFAPPPSKKGQATGREVRPFPGDTYPGCQTPTRHLIILFTRKNALKRPGALGQPALAGFVWQRRV